MAKFKSGDKVIVGVERVDSDGDLWLRRPGGTGESGDIISTRSATPYPDYSKWIGKTMADVPDGTDAVASHPTSGLQYRAIVEGGVFRYAGGAPSSYAPRDWTIHHVIRLGEVKEPRRISLSDAAAALAEKYGEPVVVVVDGGGE